MKLTMEWKKYQLKDLLLYEQPTKYIVKSTDYSSNGIPVLTAGKSFVLGYTYENDGIFKMLPTIIFDDFLTLSKFINFPFKVKSSAVKMLKLKDKKNNLKFIFEVMQTLKFDSINHQRYWISQYSDLSINMPKYKEQDTIANALSDADELIENLENLIEKKEQIKQGTMQQLLTSKKCLPGFTDKWIKVLFGGLYIKAKEGGTPDTNVIKYYKNGNIPFVKIEDLKNKYISNVSSFITEIGLKQSSAWLLPVNTVIFSNGATIGDVSINKIKLATKQGILGIIPNNKIYFEFFYYYLKSKNFYNKVRSIITKGTMEAAYIKDIDTIEISIPRDIKEQKAIANILTDMDNEIDDLKSLLEKYKNIKQAMMQQLLTGKIRLI